MSKANLFLLLPETSPVTTWSKSNADLQTESQIQHFISTKVAEISSADIENFIGYYDKLNVENFFEHFDTLDDLYPPIKRVLLNRIKDWENWREKPIQNFERFYKIFNQKIKNHTLPELAERKNSLPKENFVLLNNNALKIQNSALSVKIPSRTEVNIEIVKNTHELKKWFSLNRIPVRKFHVVPKHGENGRGNWKSASPLMCSKQKAQNLLNTAIGKNTEKLFNFDDDNAMFIVFWNENEPKNLYHGFHLSKNSNEIPLGIKNKFNK